MLCHHFTKYEGADYLQRLCFSMQGIYAVAYPCSSIFFFVFLFSFLCNPLLGPYLFAYDVPPFLSRYINTWSLSQDLRTWQLLLVLLFIRIVKYG